MARFLLLLLTACSGFAQSSFAQSSFDAQWKYLSSALAKDDLYRLMSAVPKGGDLHNHHEYSIPMSFWLEGGIKRGYLTRFRAGCGDTLQWTALRTDSVEKLGECEQRDYMPMKKLNAAQKKAWLSAMTIDRAWAGLEKRNEFFDRIVLRLGDLERDPQLIADALVVAKKQLQAENAVYLETQADPRFFPGLSEDAGADILRKRLEQSDSLATGVAVRMQVSTLRFGRGAEDDVRDGFAFVNRNRDLWVSVNLVGREDKTEGAPARFVKVFQEMRAQYPDMKLSIHAGESAEADSHVADTIALGATRIGHGVNAWLDPHAMELLKSGTYLIEMSLISNRELGYTPDPKTNPFAFYLREGIPVCLNTDDRGVLGSSLTEEYLAAVQYFDLSWEEVVRIGRWSLKFSFVEPELKKELLARYERNVQAFERDFSETNWRRSLGRIRPSIRLEVDLPR